MQHTAMAFLLVDPMVIPKQNVDGCWVARLLDAIRLSNGVLESYHTFFITLVRIVVKNGV